MTASRETVGPSPVLQAGLSLLEAQRDAMIAGDTDRLARLNLRLAEWVASVPQGVAEDGGALPMASGAAVATVRANLEINATLALRVAASSTRGLEALFPASERTYGADGRARAPLVRARALAA